jgi:hypothetical protein
MNSRTPGSRKPFGKLADGLEALGDTTGELEKKAASNASSLKSNLDNLQTAFYGFADKSLTAPLTELTDILNVLAEKPEMVEKGIKTITGAVAALGAVKMGAGVMSFLASSKMFKNGGKIDVSGLDNAGGGAGIPVHVTNWGGEKGSSMMSSPEKMLSTGVPGLDPKANNAALLKGGAVKAGLLTVAAVGVQQGISAYQQMKAINADTEMSVREKEKAKGGVLGGAVGASVGAGAGVAAGALLAGKVGAMIGTAIAPGVGTAIGGAIGMLGGAAVGWIGGMAGKKVGEEIGDIAGAMAEKRALRNGFFLALSTGGLMQPGAGLSSAL